MSHRAVRLNPGLFLGLLLFWWGLTPLAFGADIPEAFGRDRNLLCVLQIRDFDKARDAVGRVLGDIYPDTTATDPVGGGVGEFLVNPDLRDLAPGTFMEALVFNSNVAKDSAVAMAFRVGDPARYRRTLAGQHGVRQEHVLDDITRYRLGQQTGQPVALYLTITPGNVAVFGYGQEAVRRSRDLYLASGAAGLMPHSRSTFRVEFAADRWGEIHGEGLLYTLDSLRADLQEDLAPGTAAEHPLGLGLSESMRAIRDLVMHLQHASLAANVSDEGLKIDARVTPKTTSALASIVRTSLAGGQASYLAERLGPDAPYRDWSSLWPALTTQSLDLIGRLSEASAGPMLDRDTRTRALAIVDTVLRAAPRDVASALVVPAKSDGGSTASAPVRLHAIRWGAPGLLPVLLDRVEGFLGSAAVQELLAQNGLDVRWSRQNVVTHLAGTPVGRTQVRLRIRREGQLGTRRGAVWEDHSFVHLDTMVEDVWLVASSLPLRHAVAGDPTAQEHVLKQMAVAMQSLDEAAPPPTDTGDLSLLSQIELRPMALAQTALHSEAWRAREDEDLIRSNSYDTYAREFAPFVAAEEPVVVRFLREGVRLRLESSISARTLRVGARACLGLGLGTQREEP